MCVCVGWILFVCSWAIIRITVSFLVCIRGILVCAGGAASSLGLIEKQISLQAHAILQTAYTLYCCCGCCSGWWWYTTQTIDTRHTKNTIASESIRIRWSCVACSSSIHFLFLHTRADHYLLLSDILELVSMLILICFFRSICRVVHIRNDRTNICVVQAGRTKVRGIEHACSGITSMPLLRTIILQYFIITIRI